MLRKVLTSVILLSFLSGVVSIQGQMTTVHPLGNAVATLVNEYQPAGKYKVVWKATDENAMQIANGTYFYRLKTNDSVQTKTLILLN